MFRDSAVADFKWFHQVLRSLSFVVCYLKYRITLPAKRNIGGILHWSDTPLGTVTYLASRDGKVELLGVLKPFSSSTFRI